MLQLRLALACCIYLTLICAVSVEAANRVTVQSKAFRVNSGPDTVGILIENDVNVIGLVIPIEMRSVSGGAFTKPPFANTTFKWQEVPNGRLATSPLGQLPDRNNRWPAALVTRNRYAVIADIADPWADCSGPTSNSYGERSLQCDGVSPDGVLYVSVSTGNDGIGEEIAMWPGSDTTPSLELIFPVNGNPGIFEIDTCCMTPGNHLVFVDEDVSPAPGMQFTKGTITLVPCACSCFSDPNCDSVISDVVDVVRTIDMAFRDSPEAADPIVVCPRSPTDVDCSGLTDAVDVVKIVNVAFRNADPATEYCEPCP